MAANRGVETLLSVFLLCCWRGTELQSTNGTSGPVTESSGNSTTEDIPEVFDEILAQEILEPNASADSETLPTTRRTTMTAIPITTTTGTREKYPSTDENYQEDGSENYHELLDNLEGSTVSKDKKDNNEKKDSSNDKYRKLSILDKILQNIGRSEDSLELAESIF